MPATGRQAAVVARMTLRALVRMRINVLLAGGAALVVVGAYWLRGFHFGGAELRFLVDFGQAATGLAGSFLAVAGTCLVFFGEIERRSVQFIVARPVPRAAWLAGLLGGVLAALAFHGVVLTLLTGGLVAWRAMELGSVAPWEGLVRGGAFLWLRSSVVAALALLACTLTRSALAASGLAMLFLVAGHLRGVAVAGGGDWMEALDGLIRVWPNLAVFEPTATAAMPVATVTAYGLGYVVLFAAGAMVIFTRRDL